MQWMIDLMQTCQMEIKTSQDKMLPALTLQEAQHSLRQGETLLEQIN